MSKTTTFEAWAELGVVSGELCVAGAMSLHDWYPREGERLTVDAIPVRVRVTVETIEEDSAP